MPRCDWCGDDPLYVAYQDQEWGRPETDGRALYEKLVLDGFQAGLAWITILRKRAAFRAVFQGFDPDRIARWGEAEVACALAEPGIVRHRGKIEAAIGNARAWRRIEEREGFAHFLWQFADHRPVVNAPRSMTDLPAESALSREMSGAEGRGLPVLRPDHRLCLHAGDWHGDRPPGGLPGAGALRGRGASVRPVTTVSA